MTDKKKNTIKNDKYVINDTDKRLENYLELRHTKMSLYYVEWIKKSSEKSRFKTITILHSGDII